MKVVKWKDFLKKYQVILVLSCIVIVMGYIKLTYKFDESQVVDTSLLITPTPQSEMSPTPTPDQESLAVPDLNGEKYPAWKLLPYYGEGFVIDRYVAPMTLAVKPKGLDKKLVETEVKAWLVENKFDGANHKIQWE